MKYEEPKEVRKTGRSTRLADEYIQSLFKKRKIIVMDHYPSKEANMFLFRKILRRLEFEHPNLSRFIKSDSRDIKNLTIELRLIDLNEINT